MSQITVDGMFQTRLAILRDAGLLAPDQSPEQQVETHWPKRLVTDEMIESWVDGLIELGIYNPKQCNRPFLKNLLVTYWPYAINEIEHFFDKLEKQIVKGKVVVDKNLMVLDYVSLHNLL